MKKKLILFRHAKSDWNTAFKADHDRPLAERGIDDARNMGAFLHSSAQLPEHVISSTAVRAKSTIELASKDWQNGFSLEFTDRLYAASDRDLLDIIHGIPENCHTVMLVGHDPVTSTITSRLIGGGHIAYPTAAMGCVTFRNRHWRDVDEATGELAWFVRPKLFSAR